MTARSHDFTSAFANARAWSTMLTVSSTAAAEAGHFRQEST